MRPVNDIVVIDFRFPMLYNDPHSTFVRAARPLKTAPTRDASNCATQVGRGTSQSLLHIPAVARWRAISPVCDPGLGRLLLVGRCLVASERHPANRVQSSALAFRLRRKLAALAVSR